MLAIPAKFVERNRSLGFAEQNRISRIQATQKMSEIQCAGWWQQSGYGQQPMRQLCLNFTGNTITGQGIDVIAPFTLAGQVREDGAVEILKHYIRRHSVLYVGQYDGEGLFYGHWDIQGQRGEWSIKLLRSNSTEADDIQEIG